MFIKNGATRHVILRRRYAIKVARITPMHVFIATVRHLHQLFLKTDVSVSNLKHKNVPAIKRNLSGLVRNFFAQCRHHMFLGIKANRAEAKYWNETRDARCMPVLKVRLWGLIIVQPRAMPMTQAQLFRSSARRLTDDPELMGAHQFGWYRGNPRVLDFAHWGDPSVLRN